MEPQIIGLQMVLFIPIFDSCNQINNQMKKKTLTPDEKAYYRQQFDVMLWIIAIMTISFTIAHLMANYTL